ncbi:unnamed protein product [Phytophthora lilii]|uniref:Unnamed protein product n=1 Tax=Phytophthora lilii TaxID=2077276 RepID=A0A9W6XFE8_9STRA|nr:unnamed protein product [Phytophthora lilii]
MMNDNARNVAQPNTPAIAEVVHTPTPSVIKPVEVSNTNFGIGINNSNDYAEEIAEAEKEFFFEQYIETGKVKQFDVKENSLDPLDVIGAFNEYIACKNLDIKGSEMIDSYAYFGGYRYCFYIQKGNKTLRHFYCKNEQMMINIPIMIDELNVAQYCVLEKIYDHRLYDLCCLMKWSWFNDNNNTWNLAGMLYKKQHVDLGLMRNTYLCILQTMTDRFDQAAALRVFNDWETCKYHPKLTESHIKSIAGGTNPIEYNKWKAEYEPKEIKEKKEKKDKFDMMFDINNAIELDDDGQIKTDNTEFDTDSIMRLPICNVIYHYRDDITYGKVDFMPCNAKIGACNSQLSKIDWNSNEVFNKFNGFVHTYDPNFVVDETNFNCFTEHIKHIWGVGREGILSYNMKLFAWYVQRPYEKSGACVVLEGEEGCGKNTIYEILFNHVIGKKYCLETPKIKILTGRFNASREHKIITVLNEAANVKQSSHEDQDELKDCITEPTGMIGRKGIDPYRIKDCNNIVIASNNSYSVKASNQMRRFVIDLEGFHPQNDAPMTKEKSDMQQSAIEKPIQWLIECVANGTSSSIFSTAQLNQTPSTLEFVSIDNMLTKFTQWMIEESRDTSSYTRDRFSKTLTKILGPNYKKQVDRVRRRGYDLSVDSLREMIIKHTRRTDLFDDKQ